MDRETLWNCTKSYFETDDGSLPEIAIGNLRGKDREKVFSLLCSYFESKNIDATYVIRKSDFVESSPFNKALLRRLEDNEITRIQFLVKGLKIHEASLPDLGILILSEEVILDYRMGCDWTPKTVFSLFCFLKELRQAAPDSILIIPDSSGGGFPDIMKKEFEEVFETFMNEFS
jgi:hypothetical protein